MLTEGSYNIVRALRDGICGGIKKGWPDEAEEFSGIVIFCLTKWAKKNIPEKITFRFSELAEFLGLPDAESAQETFRRFSNKININFEYESNYVFEIIGDPGCPDEIKTVSIKDKPELFDRNEATCNIPLFYERHYVWDQKDKDGAVTITIYEKDELNERIINEDLSSFKIELVTPYNFHIEDINNFDMLDIFFENENCYQTNADERHIEVTVTVKMNEVEQ